MFYITKGKEPPSLTQYKKTKGAYFDGFSKKNNIRQALLEEQGYLCAYCMRRINNISEATIEHYLPQSEIDEALGLDYRYMLAVCKLNRECSHKNQTCDAHRNNERLKVNPWDKHSISLISYDKSTGNIYSKDPEINRDLAVTLNLNCKEARLPLNRKAALSSLMKYITKLHSNGTWDSLVLSKVKERYLLKNASGKYEPYIGILLWYLDSRMSEKNR